ncbi:MAG TPA: GMC family oxidoreductase [Methylomirabilota bacterium]|nr:GMC family oxidoreductase [Methylomirabilota bacterium]
MKRAELLKARRFVHTECARYFRNATPDKPWVFSRALGGGSNCWFGSTPRMLPEDFQLRSRYGVGEDWPLTYDELEPYYCEVERIMDISGPAEPMPYPMSRPYPQPPHQFSEPDRILKAAYPESFFAMPTARARVGNTRGICCNNGVCHLCPVDAKFTIENGLPELFENPSVELVCDAEVTRLETGADTVSHVVFRHQGGEHTVACDLVALGANGIFNPSILLRSGMDHPQLGKGLCQQVGVTVMVTLAGVKNFQGSTITSGLGFNGLGGDHRRHRAGFLFHTVNRASNIGLEPGRALAQLELIFVIEDLRQPENTVIIDPSDPSRPRTSHRNHSNYAQRTVDALPSLLPDLLRPLPVERIAITEMRRSESHIHGTTVMHADPQQGIVDKHSIHHRFRNLVVLGGGNFPTASPANPTLTISALALYAGRHLMS